MNTAIASAPRRWFFISMLCIACNKDDGDAPPTTLAQAAAQADEATAKPTADPARPPIVAPAAGHVRVAALSTLVDKARNQLAPGALAGMVTTDALLDKLVETADQKELGKALDLDKAMACVLARGDRPLLGKGVCALSVRGGAKAFMPAFDAPFATAQPGSHVAHFVRPPDPDGDETEPIHAYLDDLLGYVVISDQDGGFTALGDAAVSIAERPGRDLEIALYPAALAEALGPELRADLQAAADGRKSPSELRKQLTETMDDAMGSIPGLGADDAAQLEDSLSSLDDTTPEEAKRFIVLVDALLTLASEVPEIGVGINIEPAGIVLASWMRTTPGSSLQKALRAEPKLALAQFRGLPSSSVVVRGSVPVAYSPLGSVDPVLLEELGLRDGIMSKVVALGLESLTEDNADPTLAADLEAFLAEQAPLYTGASTWAAFGDGTGGPYGVMLGWPLAEGASARDSWAAAAKRFPPERILGKDGAKEFQWSLRPDADLLGETPVDRWSVWSKPSTEALKEEGTGEVLAIVEPFADALEFSIDIDTLERDEVFTAIFTKTGKSALGLLGEDASAAPAGLPSVFERSDHLLSLWAVDVRAMRQLVLALYEDAGPEVKATLEKEVGTDFGDVYGATYLTEDGGVAEFVVSQQVIDQLRRL